MEPYVIPVTSVGGSSFSSINFLFTWATDEMKNIMVLINCAWCFESGPLFLQAPASLRKLGWSASMIPFKLGKILVRRLL